MRCKTSSRTHPFERGVVDTRLQQHVENNAVHQIFSLLENLDSKLIAFSILALCKKNARAANNREIERKYLLRGLPDKLNRSRCYIIDQGYLASEPAGRQVRLRKKGTAATLTFKVGRGSHREEREIRLSPKQFDALWPGTTGRRLRKVRCEIPWKNLVVEIDIYQGRHAGLVVAEVEFPDRVSCRKFKPPSWFGREVTGEKRYSNVRLANE